MAQMNAYKITVSSSDEKTGIQALSHSQTTSMKPGKTKRVESEYKRNGTTCLIASKNISTGQKMPLLWGKLEKKKII